MAPKLEEQPDEVSSALELIPQFEMHELNETGANGYVLIGRHNILKCQVALKIYFHTDGDIDEEPAILAGVVHPNVMRVLDARKVADDCSYYMTPAAEEGDLAVFLDKYHLSTNLSHKLLCQLLSGLSALHFPNIGIVHRDLKPENLLVHKDELLIADFGSARKINAKTGTATASKHSILYRPPETFGDHAFYDKTSDVYQAGIIGYLLFGGTLSNELERHLTKKEMLAFEAIDKNDGFAQSKYIDCCVQQLIEKQKLLDWSTVPCFVPNSLKRVLRKATRDHAKRYQSVSEFLSELARVKLDMPDWIYAAEGLKLENWNGNDYVIEQKGELFSVRKKRHGSISFRADNTYTPGSLQEVHAQLIAHIGLPS